MCDSGMLLIYHELHNPIKLALTLFYSPRTRNVVPDCNQIRLHQVTKLPLTGMRAVIQPVNAIL